MFVCKVLLLIILLVLESTHVFSQNECRTIDGAGPQRNKPCMFPFILEDPGAQFQQFTNLAIGAIAVTPVLVCI